jgi:hypothetical protein
MRCVGVDYVRVNSPGGHVYGRAVDVDFKDVYYGGSVYWIVQLYGERKFVRIPESELKVISREEYLMGIVMDS